MATETQKRFKKQMGEIEKEIFIKNQDSHYSYIEKDYISSYYYPKKRKRIIGISIGSIISFILISFSLFSWFRPIADVVIPNKSDTPVNVHSPSMQLNNNQIEVVNCLDKLKPLEEDANLCIQNSVNQFNALSLKDKTQCDSYIRINTEYLSKVYSDNIQIKKLKVPDTMTEFCKTLSVKYSAIYEEMRVCNNIASGFKKSSDVNFNILSDKINTQIIKQKAELMKVFDSVGIKYENKNGEIKYWY